VETFEELWFAPVDVSCRDAVYVQHTSVIIDIMAQCRYTGYRSFERLLDNVSRHLLYNELFVSAVIATVSQYYCLLLHVIFYIYIRFRTYSAYL